MTAAGPTFPASPPTGGRRRGTRPVPAMGLWRLEWLRLVRTRRWVAVIGTYALFGFTGPLLARYMEDLVGSLGTDEIQIIVPDPQPVDGIAQFVGNAAQLGLLAVVVVSAGALALDARPEMGVFLRTRVDRPGSLLVPRFVASAALAVVAWVIGVLAAWYETVVLLGTLPAGAMVVGTLYGALFLVFAVALTALTAALTRSTVAAGVGALAALFALVVVGIASVVAPWLPTHLVGALPALVDGAPASDYFGAAAVAVVGSAAALAAAARLVERREL